MDKDRLEIIVRHFSGETSPEEEQYIANALSNDPQFRKEYNEQRELIEGIRIIGIKRMVQNFEKEYDKPVLRAFHNRRVLLLAASLSAIVLIAVFLLFNINREERLFARYFEPYPSLAFSERSSNDMEDLYQRAFAAYNNGEFDDAISYLRQILDIKQDDYIEFYLGNAYLAKRQYDESIPLFENLLSSMESQALKDQAKWYLSLGYLGAGQKDHAASILKELKDGNSIYAESANKLLTQIN